MKLSSLTPPKTWDIAMLTRRRVVASFGALLALPAAVRAQTAAGMRRIVWFGLGPKDARSPYVDALRAELRELGWSEGRNLMISRYGSTHAPDDFEVLAREIVAAKPEVVVTRQYTVYALHRIQATLPVVFGFSGDPSTGIDGRQADVVTPVESYAHPGANYTGMNYLASGLVGKRIEFPRTRCRTYAGSPDAKLPAISGRSTFAESGVLLNYGPNLRDLYRGLARYVNRILRGAKPADLPVESPRTVELVVNAQTAKRWASRSRPQFCCAPIE
jgi:ABC-type uncharacterized transport system substrate-binding protein